MKFPPRGTPVLCLKATVLVFALCGTRPAPAQNAAERTPLQIGFEQRVRNENWNNLFDMSDRTDDQTNQIRYRTRLWVDAPLPFNVDAHVGLAQETNQKVGNDNAFDEVFFETAYLDFRRVFSDRVRLRAGRQNFSKGDGFLFSEGGPWDGSRAAYFNGFDLSYSTKTLQAELIGIYDPKRDRFLPRINDRQRLLVDWDEQALGVYLTKNLRRGSLEGYYFVMKELRDYRPVSNALYQPDRRINTAGGRAVRPLTRSLSVTGEFAVQRGVEAPGRPVRAWGGYGYAKRTFDRRLKPWVKGGYWALSGARPGEAGGWDPIFTRGAIYGDLNLYSELNEKSVGYISNLKMAHAEAGFTTSKKLAWRFVYEHMTAFHPSGMNPRIFGTGLGRGENVQARADFTVNENVRGHVDFETLLPGSFYAVADRAYFLRFEMIFQCKERLSSLLKSHD